MNEIAPNEIYGIGAVAVALIFALYKVGMAWVNKAAGSAGDTQQIMVALIKENVEANMKLAGAVEGLKHTVNKQSDVFSALLINLTKTHGKH